MHELGLSEYDAGVLTDDKYVALYFEELLKNVKSAKTAANWMMGEVKGYINEMAIEIQAFPLSPAKLAEIINMVVDGKMGQTLASQQLFPLLAKDPTSSAMKIAEQHALVQVGDEDELRSWVEEAVAKFPDKVEEYRNGKKGILGLFMGEVMRNSKGKADPNKTNELIRQVLEN